MAQGALTRGKKARKIGPFARGQVCPGIQQERTGDGEGSVAAFRSSGTLRSGSLFPLRYVTQLIHGLQRRYELPVSQQFSSKINHKQRCVPPEALSLVFDYYIKPLNCPDLLLGTVLCRHRQFCAFHDSKMKRKTSEVQTKLAHQRKKICRP